MSETNNQKPTGRRKVWMCTLGVLALVAIGGMTLVASPGAMVVLGASAAGVVTVVMGFMGANYGEHREKAKAFTGQAKPGG